MHNTALARPLAWLLAALSLGLTLAALADIRLSGEEWLATHLLFGPATAVAYALVGALVAVHRPHNPIGWIFSVEGVFTGLTVLVSGEPPLGFWSRGYAPAVDVARWLALWAWMPTTILPLSFVLLLFPDGRLPSPRWRPIAWVSGVGLVLYVVSAALHPRPQIEPIPPVNPFGIPGAEAVLEPLSTLGGILVVIGVFGSLAALVVRFRRSQGIEREQLQWLAYGGALALLCLTLISGWAATRAGDPLAYELNIGSVWVVLTIIVVAAGIAILRHRLYAIDLLINRTLVYGALSAGVVGLYVLLVGALGTFFQSRGNLVLGLLATGLAAFLVQPMRARLQRSVNHLMYGERDDPYAVLSRLSQQLKTTLAPTAVLPTIVEAVAEALKLPYVAVALQQNGALVIAAEYSGKAPGRQGAMDRRSDGARQPQAAAPVSLALVYQAETIGQLLVAPRAPGETFTAAERRLLDDLALQVGVAAHAVRLTADLQRSRERLVTAREEERRRLRRDLHDGLGPQLASLTLMLGAVRELLRYDTAAADRLLGELALHTQAANADIRRVVYALRPTALDDLGLVLALREQAGHYRQAGLEITIDAPEHLPPLPAAVEVAAYSIAREALTNVVRHAQAATCVVRLTLGDALAVEVTDDGVGLPPDGRAGVGLRSMRERTAELGGSWRIESAPGAGTCIHACLPLPQEAP